MQDLFQESAAFPFCVSHLSTAGTKYLTHATNLEGKVYFGSGSGSLSPRFPAAKQKHCDRKWWRKTADHGGQEEAGGKAERGPMGVSFPL